MVREVALRRRSAADRALQQELNILMMSELALYHAWWAPSSPSNTTNGRWPGYLSVGSLLKAQAGPSTSEEVAGSRQLK